VVGSGDAVEVRTTFRLECCRSVFAGVVESVVATFALLVAVRHFGASSSGKAWLVAGPNIGLMAGPAVVAVFRRAGLTPVAAAAIVQLAAALLFGAAALVVSERSYVLLVAAGGAAVAATVPLMTQVYQDAYPDADRGRLFSRAFFIRIAASVGAGALLGRFLDWRPDGHSWVLGGAAICCGMSSVLVSRFPRMSGFSGATECETGSRGGMLSRTLAGLRFVGLDAVFRRTLISWMFLGIGNLVMLPLRVELLALPDSLGTIRTAADIALLTAVIPNVARLATTLLWGRLFDRCNFFVLRALLNFLFAAAILAFFLGDRMWVLVLGAVLYGVANSGGDVVWSLWVTKVTIPERVADYMAVHTCFTGVRGVLAPVIAYAAMERFPLGWTAWGCAIAIVLANVILLPEILEARRAREGFLGD
jgi:MFS family permease